MLNVYWGNKICFTVYSLKIIDAIYILSRNLKSLGHLIFIFRMVFFFIIIFIILLYTAKFFVNLYSINRNRQSFEHDINDKK